MKTSIHREQISVCKTGRGKGLSHSLSRPWQYIVTVDLEDGDTPYERCFDTKQEANEYVERISE